VPVQRPLPEDVPDSVTPHRYARMLEVLDRRQPDLTVVLEDVHDSHNAGAVARSCEAVGVGVLHLVEAVERAPAPSSGTTSSAHLWIEIRRHVSVGAAYTALRAQGFAIVATAIGADAREPWAVDFTRPTALVLGNEQRGVSAEAAAAADLRVLIPMRGMVQSLNLSVAAGALLFEAMRQRQAAAMYDRPRLAESDRRRILETWLDRERGNPAP
jgi:tRNA (guanosine-2'-O-)-methyltransferase